MSYNFVDKHIELDTLPKKFKKLTATRFATVMGLNAWATPFAAWCEITKTYEEPFKDNIYTIAGKTIEPKICEYLKDRYFLDIKSPTDVYGPDYFMKTWGDFFPDVKALGGMWDFIGDDFVVEVKTTKRSEDWYGEDGKVEPPIYYKLQACLYAYLLGFDDVMMSCSFLQDKDYANPDAFVPDLDNTVVVEFKLSEEFPNFTEDYIEPALKFWDNHVITGVSPDFDDKKDADILKALRKNTVEVTDKELTKLMREGDRLKARIDKVKARIADKENRLKEIDDTVKKSMIDKFRDGDKNVEIQSAGYTWNLRKDISKSFNKKKFEADYPGKYEKYVDEKPKYVLTKKEIVKEEI